MWGTEPLARVAPLPWHYLKRLLELVVMGSWTAYLSRDAGGTGSVEVESLLVVGERVFSVPGEEACLVPPDVGGGGPEVCLLSLSLVPSKHKAFRLLIDVLPFW